MNVLIVEDDRGLARELGLFLHQERYQCDFARTGREASEKLFVNDYDFVLLDLGLPDQDGLQLLAQVRRERQSPASIIILSARGSVDDRINGLDLGADDYLPKPYSLLELLSRMQAVTRRKHGVRQDALALGGFTLNLSERTLRYGSTALDLTRKEFDLLHYLLLHRGKVLTRQQLSEHIWGSSASESTDHDSNFIDVHVKNVRKKLAQHEPGVEWIETVRGVGYRLKADATSPAA
ncbi:response regulator transcription factor [Hymenobacter arizonensis]|uniref:DNA-binding response regulator, OmpR family, contains REC and winged-helix (WHTH) domain n=1 Tax=Hymenobacter arizonensis TaxID=1227077 RepID=A0A1I5Z7G2_HYMAR|nr:response regulator transcription factor [Hymenobacter arizonensis]SFQ52398.1 DNA-binding response regulator, OmpR family, contains REC and winged-helix (wHTH) domain [Hymenobacter arizonensis]